MSFMPIIYSYYAILVYFNISVTNVFTENLKTFCRLSFYSCAEIFQKVIEFEAEIPDTFYQLDSDLVSINLFNSKGELVKYRGGSRPLEITFQIQVLLSHCCYILLWAGKYEYRIVYLVDHS